MEVIEQIINYRHGGEVRVYPIGDIHFGSIHCDEDAIEREIELIRKDKDGYIIGMGDYADSILKNDPRFDIEGLPEWLKKGNIMESERERVVKLFKPVQKKVITLLTGNHEEELHIRFQDDITRNICKDLVVPYGGYSCFLALKFERSGSNDHHTVIIHAWHGAGAAQTEGARLMRLVRLVNDIQADIYLMGHLHAMTQHTPDRLVFWNGKVKSIRLAATITGSWLKAYTQPEKNQELPPSYAEKKGYKPSRIGTPIIHIRPETKEFTIES